MSTFTRLSFDIRLDANGTTFPIDISDPDGLSADNLPLATWGSAQILADVLHRIPVDLDLDSTSNTHECRRKVLPVLELGAGTGVAGLAAAAVWNTHAVLTDLVPILPGIAANVGLNSDRLRDRNASAKCGTLDWAAPEKLQIVHDDRGREIDGTTNTTHDTAARVILAADTIYSEEHPELLTNAIKAWLEPGEKSRFIMCYPLRVGYLDHIRGLWERLEGCGLASLQEGREQVDKQWDEDVPYEWCVWHWKSESALPE